jgi:predicted secreted protein
MPTRFVYRLLLLWLLPALTSAYAANDKDILFNQVFLQASVRGRVENDRLAVTLVAEARGKTPVQVTGEVNEAMSWAVKKAKTASGVDVQTGSYRTSPVYRDQTIIAWRASQQLLLKSADITGLAELVGELQQRLQVRQMRFTVSPAARRKMEDALIGKAMEAFKQRVKTVQKHMDGKDYRIVSLHINMGSPPPVVYPERALPMQAGKAPPPSAEPGNTEITVTVSGSVQFF